jgi:hypothetical protein
MDEQAMATNKPWRGKNHRIYGTNDQSRVEKPAGEFVRFDRHGASALETPLPINATGDQ